MCGGGWPHGRGIVDDNSSSDSNGSNGSIVQRSRSSQHKQRVDRRSAALETHTRHGDLRLVVLLRPRPGARGHTRVGRPVRPEQRPPMQRLQGVPSRAPAAVLHRLHRPRQICPRGGGQGASKRLRRLGRAHGAEARVRRVPDGPPRPPRRPPHRHRRGVVRVEPPPGRVRLRATVPRGHHDRGAQGGRGRGEAFVCAKTRGVVRRRRRHFGARGRGHRLRRRGLRACESRPGQRLHGDGLAGAHESTHLRGRHAAYPQRERRGGEVAAKRPRGLCGPHGSDVGQGRASDVHRRRRRLAHDRQQLHGLLQPEPHGAAGHRDVIQRQR